MSSRFYPIYQMGNPQLRVFLPNFWMKLVKPEEPQPPNVVQFITPTGMTDYDIKNYLEKIYKVKVVRVVSDMEDGKIKEAYKGGYLVKEEDFRRAYVYLPRDQKFEFPIFETDEIKSEKKKEREDLRKRVKDNNRKYATATAEGRYGVPNWFQL